MDQDRPFELNDRVKEEGSDGYFWVRGYAQDGSVKLWGGSRDPNGNRVHRSVFPHQLKIDTRKLERKAFPEPVSE